MTKSAIKSLKDLEKLRTAPSLNSNEAEELFEELLTCMSQADWFTVGIMADSEKRAISVLRQVENRFTWSAMKLMSIPKGKGPVFLKANQKSDEVIIRIEYGLGEGVLISCQHDETEKTAETLGPFPLDFFI